MKSGFHTTGAVVLNSFDYGESDRIIVFYTEDHGKLRGMARGARRSRRRFVNNLEPLSHIRLTFFHRERSDLVRIEEARLMDAFPGLRGDIESLTRGYYLLELVSETTREGQSNPRIYALLVDFLRMMEEDREAGPLPVFFGIRLLRILGLMPHLSGCVVCRDLPSGPGGRWAVYFSSQKGGTVCSRCAGDIGASFRISPGTAKLLSMASRLDTSRLVRLKTDDSLVRESERLLDDFITYHLGKELKTKRFFEKLRGAGAG